MAIQRSIPRLVPGRQRRCQRLRDSGRLAHGPFLHRGAISRGVRNPWWLGQWAGRHGNPQRIAFAASSLVVVFPGSFSRWLLRNRRIIGLCFAAGMAWQLFFILWMVIGFWDYYIEEAYSYFDLSEQLPGYLLLTAMVVTSFRFGRSKLSARQWKILHKGGIYFLWGVVWSTYWFELFYYEDVQVIDYVYYWAGFAAWGVRILAWSKKRTLQPAT